MLISFSVENYKVFREKAVLSLEACSDKRFPENLIQSECTKKPLLKLSAVYGANASGKTTLLHAMKLYTNFICMSAGHDLSAALNYTPFAFGDCENKPTVLEAEFVTNGIRYQYGFSYNRERVTTEHLYSYPRGKKCVVFERDGDSYEFKSEGRFRTENSKRVRDKCLFVSVCSQFNDPDCINVVNWASKEMLSLIDYDVGYSLSVLTNLLTTDTEFRELALRSFKIADLGIVDVRDRIKSQTPVGAGSATVVMPIQDIWVRHEYNRKTRELPITMESSGTIRFLAVIGPVIDALRHGLTLMIDEIDMSFHPDLCRWIVGLFLDPAENRRNAQLVLNTHDVSFLDQAVIRRDQVFFAEKDWETGEAGLKRLSDFGIRSDLDIRKAYLNGSFGGKPFIAPDKLMENAQ